MISSSFVLINLRWTEPFIGTHTTHSDPPESIPNPYKTTKRTRWLMIRTQKPSLLAQALPLLPKWKRLSSGVPDFVNRATQFLSMFAICVVKYVPPNALVVNRSTTARKLAREAIGRPKRMFATSLVAKRPLPFRQKRHLRRLVSKLTPGNVRNFASSWKNPSLQEKGGRRAGIASGRIVRDDWEIRGLVLWPEFLYRTRADMQAFPQLVDKQGSCDECHWCRKTPDLVWCFWSHWS